MEKNEKEPSRHIRERLKNIRILNEFSDIIVKNISDPTAIMRKGLDYAMRLTGFEAGYISRVDYENERAIGITYHNIGRVVFNKINKISSKSLSKLLRFVLPSEVAHLQNYSDVTIPYMDYFKKQNYVDFIIAVAEQGGIPYAIIFLCSKKKHTIKAYKLRVIRAFVRQLGAALAQIDVNRELIKSRDSLRIANQLWASTFDAIRDAVLITDREGKIIRSNKASFDILGIEPDKIIGRNVFEYAHLWCSKCEEIFPKVLSSGKSYDFEVKLQKNEKFLVVTISPIHRGIDISGTLLIIRDITEKKKMWEQLAQKQKLESVGFLASGVAHNFNNILMSIMGNLYQLESELGDAYCGEVEKIIKSIQNSIDDATDTIRQLLSFSRAHTGDKSKIDPSEFLSEFEFLDKAFPNNVSIETRVNCENCWIFGNSQKLKQALMNLLINAKDAMPNGGKILIEIDKKKLPVKNPQNLKSGEYVVISVQDEGIGISDENLPKIFDPFFTTKEAGKGTGLGLSLVYNSIKSMDGEIEVYSQVGQGTKFTIFLPAVGPPKIYEKQTKRQVPAKLLLVEDDGILNNLFENFLGKRGYEVESAKSAKDALKRIEKIEPDIAIIDAYLPDSAGEDFIWAIAKKCPKTPIVVISGSNPEQNVTKLLDSGRGAFLLKPFKLLELDETIQNLLEKKMKSPRWN